MSSARESQSREIQIEILDYWLVVDRERSELTSLIGRVLRAPPLQHTLMRFQSR